MPVGTGGGVDAHCGVAGFLEERPAGLSGADVAEPLALHPVKPLAKIQYDVALTVHRTLRLFHLVDLPLLIRKLLDGSSAEGH